MRPHRWQPPRLRLPWDSPGKNNGVGCHCLLQCLKVKSESEVVQSCPTLSDPMDGSLPDSNAHGIFQARVPESVAIAFSTLYHYCSLNYSTEENLMTEIYEYSIEETNSHQMYLKSPVASWKCWANLHLICVGFKTRNSVFPQNVGWKWSFMHKICFRTENIQVFACLLLFFCSLAPTEMHDFV